MKCALVLVIIVFALLAGCGTKGTDTITKTDFNGNTQTEVSENTGQKAQTSVTETAQQKPEIKSETAKTPEKKEDAKNAEAKTGQTNEERAIMRSLYEAGIDANAQIQDSGTTITFTLPAGLVEKNTAYYVFGIASNFTRPEKPISVEISGEKSVSYTVFSGKVADFFNGRISEKEFEKEVKIGGT